MTTKADRRRKKKITHAVHVLKKQLARTSYRREVCLVVAPEGLKVYVQN